MEDVYAIRDFSSSEVSAMFAHHTPPTTSRDSAASAPQGTSWPVEDAPNFSTPQLFHSLQLPPNVASTKYWSTTSVSADKTFIPSEGNALIAPHPASMTLN